MMFFLLDFGSTEVYVKKRDKVKSMFSGFAELGRALFVGVTQILQGMRNIQTLSI
jgi:hypothetical protein